MYNSEEVSLEDSDLELQIKITFQDRQVPQIVRDPLLEVLGKRFELVSKEDLLWSDLGSDGSVIGRTQLQERLIPAMHDAAREIAVSGGFREYEALRESGLLK